MINTSSITRQAMYWDNYLEQQLIIQLERVIRRIKRHGAPDLMPHMGSVFTLLEKAHRISSAGHIAVQLIEKIHPWPVRWGYADRWLIELKFAEQFLRNKQSERRRAELVAHLSDLYLHTRQHDLAVEMGQAAQVLARQTRSALAYAVGSSSIVGTLKAIGQHYEAGSVMAQAENELNALHFKSSLIKHAEAAAILSLEKYDLLRRQGYIEEALRTAGEHINRIKSFPRPNIQLLGTLYECRGVLYWSQSQYALATKDLDLANDCFKAGQNEISQASTEANRGLTLFSMANYLQAEAALRNAIKLTQRCNYLSNLTRQIGNLGLIYLGRGMLGEARLYMQQALNMAIQTNNAGEKILESGNLATLQVYQGEFEAARPHLEETVYSFRQLNNLEILCGALIDLAICLHGLGEAETAQQNAREAMQLAIEVKLDGPQVIAMRCLAHVGAAADPVEVLSKAQKQAQQLNRRLDFVGCSLSLCQYTSPEQAAALWKQAETELQAMGAEIWLQGRTPENPPLLPLFV